MTSKPFVKCPSGAQLKARRLELRLTQQALGERARIDPRVISAYENDKRHPRTKNLARLLKALGLSEDPTGAPAPFPDGRAPEVPGGTGDHERWAIFQSELTRLIGARDAKLIVFWADGERGLLAVTRGQDKRLGAIHSRGASATIDDFLSLRALVDDLLGEVQGSAP